MFIKYFLSSYIISYTNINYYSPGVDMQEYTQPIIELSYRCIGFSGKTGFNTINVGLKPLKMSSYIISYTDINYYSRGADMQ